jgi:hypothetical protein
VKTAQKVALTALAGSVMALVAPMTVANADQGDTLKGGCHFSTNQQQTATNGQNEGAIADLSVSQEASGGPSGATVKCWIDVNGVEAPGTEISASGNGVQQASAQISFAAGDTDAVALCQQVSFDDGSTWVGPDGTNPDCPAAIETQIPPQVVIDAINNLFVTVIDPAICPELITLGQLTGGGVAGVVTIGPDGDVNVADPLALGLNPVEDCPPYQTTP